MRNEPKNQTLLFAAQIFWLALLACASIECAAQRKAAARTAAKPPVLYAAPNGTGTSCAKNAPCDLFAARDKLRAELVRQANKFDRPRAAIVFLRGGVYELRAALELNEKDSGVAFAAYPGETPILSGGRAVKDWQMFDREKEIYRAFVGRDVDSRQFYVNNARAARARTNVSLANFKRTDAGYLAPDDSINKWKNVSGAEVVGYNEWRAHRCPIEKIENRQIFIKQPCWTNAARDRWRIDNLQRIENALELLDQPGEWYLDKTAGFLYYKPRAGENLRTARAILPVLETIVDARGAVDNPIKNVRFRGVTFSYATWLAPNDADGYALLQAGVRRTGADGKLKATPANVSFERAENVAIEDCRFEHLGAAGLNFDGGSQNNRIVGNVFTDIASHAVTIGNVFEPEQADARLQNVKNTISNNYITKIGAEYEDACAIFAGYVAETLIEHNTIENVPYTGISVGWGWGKKSYMRRNRINFNRIDGYMLRLKDGGAIYTLSDQPDSEANGNFIRTPATAENGGHAGLYFDEGTGFYRARGNAFDLPDNMKRGWLNLAHNNSCHDIAVEDSITTTATAATTGRTPETRGKTPPNFVLKDVQIVSREDFPEIARAIIAKAGLEPDYRKLAGARSAETFGQKR